MKYIYNKKHIVLCLFILTLLFASRNQAFASVKDPKDVIVSVKKMLKEVQTTYKEDFQWNSSITLKGMYSEESLYFYIPEYWSYEYVQAEIQYNVSQLIDDVPASLSFSVNQIPVSSCNIKYQEGRTQTASIEIPTEVLKKGFNVFEISGYVRLYDDEGCADNNAGANWIQIDKNSFIRVGYEVDSHNSQIASYPYPFISTMDPQGEETGIFVSGKMENTELASAMYLMADLGSLTKKENQITLGTLNTWNSSVMKRRIVIAKTENLTPELSAFIEDKNALKDKAMVKLVKDSQENDVLLITSEDGDCLLEAVHMLMDEDRVSQEKSSLTYVKKGNIAQMQQWKSADEQNAKSFTLKDITGTGLSFVGLFHQKKDVTLPVNDDFVLGDGGNVTLKYRFSENLDFRRSMITVYWGDIPVASKKLKLENASGDELTFKLPSDVVGTKENTLSIAFDLEVPDLYCTERQDDMPWAYVTEESGFYLPRGNSSTISFDNMPIPFLKDGIFSDLMLIIPDSPTIEELNVLAQVIAMYGNDVEPYGNLKVIRAGEFSKEDADYNIIAIGNYQNDFLKQMNDKLSFQYSAEGNSFESNDKMMLSDNYAGNIAVLQLLSSPYAENRTILAICGTDDKSLSNVKDLIQIKENRWKLTNDCAIIDSGLSVRTFEFLKDVVNEDKPTFSNFVSENKDSIIFTLVSTSVMLMLLLAVIIIFIRLKTNNKKGNNK